MKKENIGNVQKNELNQMKMNDDTEFVIMRNKYLF